MSHKPMFFENLHKETLFAWDKLKVMTKFDDFENIILKEKSKHRLLYVHTEEYGTVLSRPYNPFDVAANIRGYRIHPYFAQGCPVAVAGEIEIQMLNGKIQVNWFNNVSGHYRPYGKHLPEISSKVLQNFGFADAAPYKFRSNSATKALTAFDGIVARPVEPVFPHSMQEAIDEFAVHQVERGVMVPLHQRPLVPHIKEPVVEFPEPSSSLRKFSLFQRGVSTGQPEIVQSYIPTSKF